NFLEDIPYIPLFPFVPYSLWPLLPKADMLIIMKFGGTSVGNAERIGQAADLALKSVLEGHEVVVITSAMSGVTNQLIDTAQKSSKGDWHPGIREQLFARHFEVAQRLLHDASERRDTALRLVEQRLDQFEKLCFGLSMVHELTPRLLDIISGMGERLCAPLLAATIAAKGKESISVEATELIVTNDLFGAAEPLMDKTREKTQARLKPLIANGVIPVITGFIGATEDGLITTLGRGGSDYSASIIGAALDAHEIWIWTDVDGVMSANPN